MLHKLIYNFGTRKRNPSLFNYYSFLKQTDNWSYEQLQELQLKRSKDFLCFVNKYSPYYKNIFNDLDFLPENIESIQDLKELPIIEKSDLLKFNEDIHSQYSFKKVFFSETSGTSGQPLKFYRNEEWDSHNRAAMFRGYSWYNVYPWDKNGYFWGYNISKKSKFRIQLLDFLQNRFRVFSYDEKEIEAFVRKLKKAKYLSGYSSMIYEVAKLVNKMGLSNDFNLKMIKGTSEQIFPKYFEEVQAAFGGKIISEYGAAESGLIAFECPYGNMHINMENVIVEEDEGDIIVTNLLSRSFPIIRYRLGDRVKLADNSFKCKCGRSHPVLLEVMGRTGKRVFGKEKSYPSFTFYYVFKNLALNHNLSLNYQAIQEERGKVILKIEQEDKTYNHLLQNELMKYFSDDIEFSISYGQQLHTMNGKLKDFITKLD
ncbi:MAG: phenylacetate--CoA ligase family protein [Hyphomicrobiales bacterium]